jgi:excisionase family DNA binding protein
MSADEILEDGAVSIEEARRFSGIGRTALYGLMQSGRLPFAKIGARRLVPRRALVQLLAEGLTKPVAARS